MNTIIRFVHYTDLQIGVTAHGHIDPDTRRNSRLDDVQAALHEIEQYCEANHIDIAFITGDIFEKSNATATEQKIFASHVQRMREIGVVLVLIPGNHDAPLRGDGSMFVDVLKALKLPGVHCLNTLSVSYIPVDDERGITVMAMPWVSTAELLTSKDFLKYSPVQRKEEFDRRLKTAFEQHAQIAAAAKKHPRVVMSHFAVEGNIDASDKIMLSPFEPTLPLSLLADRRFQYVALGHIHKFRDLNYGFQPPVVYAGSIIRNNFSEEGEEKGFVTGELAKVEGEWVLVYYEFTEIKTTEFFTITIDANGDFVGFPDDIERMLGAIVRVRVEVEKRDHFSERETREYFLKQGAAEVSFQYKYLFDKEKRERRLETLSAKMGILEGLDEYLKIRPELSPIADDMRDRAKELISREDVENDTAQN